MKFERKKIRLRLDTSELVDRLTEVMVAADILGRMHVLHEAAAKGVRTLPVVPATGQAFQEEGHWVTIAGNAVFIKDDPALNEALHQWQVSAKVAEYQQQSSEYISSGRNSESPGAAMVRRINESKPKNQVLYRGIRADLGSLTVGQTYEMPKIQSFSERQAVAEHFGSTIFVIEGRSRSIDVNLYRGLETGQSGENEHIVAGRFKITKIDSSEGRMVSGRVKLIHLQQVGTYGRT